MKRLFASTTRKKAIGKEGYPSPSTLGQEREGFLLKKSGYVMHSPPNPKKGLGLDGM